MESFLILIVFIIIIAVLFFIPALFTAAWNTAMPAMFRLPTISFWQGFSFLLVVGLLSSILFGGLQFQEGYKVNSNTEFLSDLRQDVWAVSNKIDQLQSSIDLLRQNVTMQNQPAQ